MTDDLTGEVALVTGYSGRRESMVGLRQREGIMATGFADPYADS